MREISVCCCKPTQNKRKIMLSFSTNFITNFKGMKSKDDEGITVCSCYNVSDNRN